MYKYIITTIDTLPSEGGLRVFGTEGVDTAVAVCTLGLEVGVVSRFLSGENALRSAPILTLGS